MVLTEFLLERIAEDEAVAVAFRDGESWGNPYLGDGDGSDLKYKDRFTIARVLAECEVKRRIVELLAPLCTPERLAWADADRGPSPDVALDALRLLALPYAEHPDYREEWRP